MANNLKLEESRKISLERASELKSKVADYFEATKEIPTGFKNADRNMATKKKLLDFFNATEENWLDWKWHVRKRISDVETLSKFINLSQEEIHEIESVSKKFRWAISPYFLSVMDTENPNCTIRKQSIPTINEVVEGAGTADPMGEEFTNPAPSITRRYPDRLIINVTNQCAMYCRHCQRRRNIGETDLMTASDKIEEALNYIRKNPEIRDVLLTGGDAFTLSDDKLDWILTELDNISHVEIKRLGTRTPVTLPQRITPELCKMLEKHHPVFLNTQFNHPSEVTPETALACDRLTKAGIQVGNQSVLLKGVNNNPHIMKKLNHELLKIRVRPYYIFHAKSVIGTEHFWPSVEEGLEIMENLRGYTSGLAIPTYIINAPNGHGKTPMLPEYLISQGKGFVSIRTWENKVFKCINKT